MVTSKRSRPTRQNESIAETEKMDSSNMAFTNWQQGVIWLSLLLLWVSIAHSLEDFVYGIPARFGLSVVTAALVLGAGYVVQATGILLASKNQRSGYMLTLTTGAGWTIAAAADHLKEILTVWPYREGVISKVLEVGIMLVGAALAIASLVVLLSRRLHAIQGQ
ncbi:MAG: hypothetical protein NVS4B12_13140 [Ktedonobacteraceae bacterium]